MSVKARYNVLCPGKYNYTIILKYSSQSNYIICLFYSSQSTSSSAYFTLIFGFLIPKHGLVHSIASLHSNLTIDG